MFWKSPAKRDAAALGLLPFLDSLPEPALILEGGTTIVYVNAGMRALWPAGVEMIGHSYWDIFPELIDGPGRHCAAALRDGKPRSFMSLCVRTRLHYPTRVIPIDGFLVVLATDPGGRDAIAPADRDAEPGEDSEPTPLG